MEKYVRRLKVSREISDHEVLTMFQQINRFLQDNDSMVKLLSMLPLCRDGLVNIAQGLFSANPSIVKLSTEILQKIESVPYGKVQMRSLNYFFMLKY